VATWPEVAMVAPLGTNCVAGGVEPVLIKPPPGVIVDVAPDPTQPNGIMSDDRLQPDFFNKIRRKRSSDKRPAARLLTTPPDHEQAVLVTPK
jgi:hypothetical protein